MSNWTRNYLCITSFNADILSTIPLDNISGECLRNCGQSTIPSKLQTANIIAASPRNARDAWSEVLHTLPRLTNLRPSLLFCHHFDVPNLFPNRQSFEVIQSEKRYSLVAHPSAYLHSVSIEGDVIQRGCHQHRSVDCPACLLQMNSMVRIDLITRLSITPLSHGFDLMSFIRAKMTTEVLSPTKFKRV